MIFLRWSPTTPVYYYFHHARECSSVACSGYRKKTETVKDWLPVFNTVCKSLTYVNNDIIYTSGMPIQTVLSAETINPV